MDRRTYIGGADAAAILGLNDYQTFMKTWRKKVGLESDDLDNKHIRRGNAMEPIIEQYAVEHFASDINSPEMFKRFGTPEAVERLKAWMRMHPVAGMKMPDRPQITVRHRKYDFCGGHPDGLNGKRVWEFKAPAMRNFKFIDTQGVSMSWIIQVQYYMWITGLKEGWILVWNYDNWEPMIVRLKPNRRLHKQFEEVLPAFWFHVETETEPNFHGLPEIKDFIDTSELDKILHSYVQAVEQKYEATDQVDLLKTTIIAHMEGAELAETENYSISAKEQTRFGTTFARLIVKPIESDDSKAYRLALDREQAIQTISGLIDVHGNAIVSEAKK